MSASGALAIGTAAPRKVSAMGWRHVLPVTGAALVLAVTYVLAIVVPQYVNGLHSLPLAEVASGAHDPKDLWPRGGGAAWSQLGGFAAILFGPAVAVVGTPWCLAVVLASRGRRRLWTVPAPVAVVSAMTAALCVALLVLMFSPMGIALTTWRMD